MSDYWQRMTPGFRPDLERTLAVDLFRKAESLAVELNAVSRELSRRLAKSATADTDTMSTILCAHDITDDLWKASSSVAEALFGWIPVPEARDSIIARRLAELDDATLGETCAQESCVRRRADGAVACAECGEIWCAEHMGDHQRMERHWRFAT